MDKVLIIDSLNLIYAANNKTLQQQEGAEGDYRLVFLFFRKLRSLIEYHRPDKIFFCREGAHNFRKNLSSEYKANRLVKHGMAQFTGQGIDYQQVNIIYDLLQYLPCTVVYADKFEGDDVAFTLATHSKFEHNVLVSNDRDWLQILQQGFSKTQLYDPYKKQWLEPPSYLFLVFRSLYGDKSDNIAGLVKKKKATELASNPQKLATFLSIEENRANFSANRQLIELQLIPSDQLIVDDYIFNPEYLKLQFRQMEFASIVRTEYWDKFKQTFNNLTI